MVDENDVVKGIVSLSDILQALVLTGGEKPGPGVGMGRSPGMLYLNRPHLPKLPTHR